MYVIVTCKDENDPIKNSGENDSMPFSRDCKPIGAIYCLLNHGLKSTLKLSLLLRFL